MTALPTLKRRLCGKREAAAYLGVGPKVLLTLVRTGKLKFIMVGERKKFDVADLDRFIEEGKTQWHSGAEKAHHTGGTASPLTVVDFAEARKKRPAKRPS